MDNFPKTLGAALLNAQGMLRGVGKDGTNPHFKSRYATLENVIETIRPALQEQGILFLQAPGRVDENGVMQLTTLLVHAESGETFSSIIDVPLVKRDPQGVGSAITYACRYSLMALLGIPPVDDDGESAGRAETTNTKVISKKDGQDAYKILEKEIRGCNSVADLRVWASKQENKNRRAQLPHDWQQNIDVEYGDRLAELQQ